MQEIALQTNEEDRELFKSTLLEISECPEILLLVDDTRKDRNASQRKHAWGQRRVNLELSRWFQEAS